MRQGSVQNLAIRLESPPFRLPHVNLVAYYFFAAIKAPGAHLFCGLLRLKRGCTLKEAQTFERPSCPVGYICATADQGVEHTS